MMRQITPEPIESYLNELASRYDEPLLLEMEQYGHEHDFPIIDRLVGAFIMTMAKTAGARRVFELGSGYGYSAYWFARALGTDGRIICTDSDKSNAMRAQTYLSKAKLWDRIDFRIGEAINTLRNETGSFDIIYCDIDKGDYPRAWNVAKDKLKSGGLFICDNTLWSGRVAEAEVKDDVHEGWTEAIRKMNSAVYNDRRFDATLLPLRDGVLVARKRSD